MDHKTKNVSIVCVEGNVGVGKSTFLNFLKQHIAIDLLYEPVELWQNVDGYNLLKQFFLQPERWAYTCQSYIAATRVDQILYEQHHAAHELCIMERSLYSGRYCFAQVAVQLDWMNGMEWSLYQKMWDRQMQHLNVLPAGFIYLQASAQICMQRIAKRARTEENPVTLDYLKRLQEKYDLWFVSKKGLEQEILNIPTLILDFSDALDEHGGIKQELVDQVEKFLKKITKYNNN